ncbi:MAG: protein translocase subunit SecD [Candidatus Gracilibacteria bacterium]|nr:protein translocase subunit SecD [Candidatus Gracilibacteria bacterium]
MKNLGLKFSAIILASVIALGYILPLKEHGVNLPFDTGTYRLGLDLHGGVELDYKIDFEDLKARGQTYVERDVTEGLKSIIEKRVNSLGTAEPTISTAKYGDESHIIVQIPTQSFAGENLSEAELREKNNEYIAKAKDTIGKVVRLEFKEEKTSVTPEDIAARSTIAKAALEEAKKGGDFATLAKKFAQNNENVKAVSGSGVDLENLPSELSIDALKKITTTGLTGVLEGELAGFYSIGQDGNAVMTPGEKIFVLANITANTTVTRERDVTSTGATNSGSTTKKESFQTRSLSYEALVISQKPSEWTPAKTAAGKLLDEKYLIRAGVNFSQGFSPQVDLTFNDEGKAIFAELTKRLIGKPIAIFVGGELITAPTVQAIIPDGKAVITGQYTAESAKKLASDINTGIVPAPIYLTSERAIDAKIGNDALVVIVQAGAIGLLAIMIFLTFYYRLAGLLAGVALVVYAILLVAIFKSFGIVLSLASIAGMILSIGLAIDANILIFERTKEAIRSGMEINKATAIGFTKSWTAIWDSHVTSFSSSVVLYIFGTSLIKGFGLALGVGILLSLFTAMWVSRILVSYAGSKFENNAKAFIGISK